MNDFISKNNHKAIQRAFMELGSDLPEYLHSFTFPNEEDMLKYASSAFADKENRLYPITSKPLTVLSAMDYFGEGEYNEKLEQRIKTASVNFGIKDMVERIEGIFSDLKKEATVQVEDDPEFALILDNTGYFPIDNLYNVETSSSELIKQRDKLPSDIFYKTAKAISDAAVVHNAIIHPGVTKCASYVDCVFDKESADYQVSLRANHMDEDTVELYKELVKAASDNEEELDTYVELWEDLDSDFLTPQIRKYASFEPAYEALHGGLNKDAVEAESKNWIYIEKEDLLIPSSAVANLDMSDINIRFRKTAADAIGEIVKNASVDPILASEQFDNLSASERTLLLRVITANV